MSYSQLTNDMSIHYQQQGSGPIPIIFIHGNFGSWRHWLPCFENLPSQYTAYAPDLRGCGNSQVTDSGYDIETLSQDIQQLADNLQLDKFHLVGHSLGGAVAQELAGNHPERIITLTLVAPAPAEGMASLAKLSTKDSMFSAKNVWSFFDNIGLRKNLHTLSFKKTMPGLRNNRSFLNMLVEDALKMDIKAFDGFLKTLKLWRGTKYLASFNFPVLIMHGELDSVIPLQPLKNMQHTIENCQFYPLKNIGHAPQLEKPKAFNKALFNFLSENHSLPTIDDELLPKKKTFIEKLKLKLKHFLNFN